MIVNVPTVLVSTNVPPVTTLAVMSPSISSVAVNPGSVKIAPCATVIVPAPLSVITGTLLSVIFAVILETGSPSYPVSVVVMLWVISPV